MLFFQEAVNQQTTVSVFGRGIWVSKQGARVLCLFDCSLGWVLVRDFEQLGGSLQRAPRSGGVALVVHLLHAAHSAEARDRSVSHESHDVQTYQVTRP